MDRVTAETFNSHYTHAHLRTLRHMHTNTLTHTRTRTHTHTHTHMCTGTQYCGIFVKSFLPPLVALV